ncbi:MAG: HDOD domain-containing protein [Deltaproteobacteria bacterium]|nr:HDOD domain-containing protein [Deltaproteobacteria bacterium]
MSRDPIMETLSTLRDLPTLPTVAVEIAALLDDPGSTSKQIMELMKTDQVLTSKVLRLVNSAYYGIPGGVTTVDRAISFLGYNTIFQLLIGVSVIEFSRVGGGGGLDIREFWKHSLGVAVTGEIIADRIGFALAKETFAAGLLHDIGKVALAKLAKERFGQAVDAAKSRGVELWRAEREQGLPTHDQVGSRLAELWRFPQNLRAAIGLHHKSHELRIQTAPRPLVPLLDIVVLANLLCRRFEIGDGGDSVIPELDRPLLARLGLLESDVSQVRGEIARKTEKSKVFLDLLGDDV